MYQCRFSLSEHPPARTGAATRTGVSEYAGVREGPAPEKESGSPVCGVEESDRAAPLALTPPEVRPRAVLPGGHGAEPETAGAVPEPSARTQTGHGLEYR